MLVYDEDCGLLWGEDEGGCGVGEGEGEGCGCGEVWAGDGFGKGAAGGARLVAGLGSRMPRLCRLWALCVETIGGLVLWDVLLAMEF